MNRFHGILLPLLCLLPLGCTPPSEQAEPRLLIFAAASLTEVMPEIALAYAAETHAPAPQFNFAGSNILARQLLAAPRADLFLSADEQWVDVLEEAGRLMPATRSVLLSNQLVVIAHPSTNWTLDDPSQVADLPFRYLALGDPDAVPAGRYAKQWLESVHQGEVTIWIRVKDRIAPSPDVRAALSQVAANADLLGIVYTTDFTNAGERVKALYRVPREDAPPIRYVLAELKDASPGASSFRAFLLSPAAQAIFTRHGFEVNF